MASSLAAQLYLQTDHLALFAPHLLLPIGTFAVATTSDYTIPHVVDQGMQPVSSFSVFLILPVLTTDIFFHLAAKRFEASDGSVCTDLIDRVETEHPVSFGIMTP